MYKSKLKNELGSERKIKKIAWSRRKLNGIRCRCRNLFGKRGMEMKELGSDRKMKEFIIKIKLNE